MLQEFLFEFFFHDYPGNLYSHIYLCVTMYEQLNFFYTLKRNELTFTSSLLQFFSEKSKRNLKAMCPPSIASGVLFLGACKFYLKNLHFCCHIKSSEQMDNLVSLIIICSKFCPLSFFVEYEYSNSVEKSTSHIRFTLGVERTELRCYTNSMPSERSYPSQWR